MANSILKLKVENEEYDAKLKKAAEGVRHLADVAHQSAGDMTGLDKSTLDYIKSIGEMETKSRTAAGSVRELESTYKELKVIYDQLNDVEKADEGGKALAASLDKLKQRAIDARAEMDGVNRELSDSSNSSSEAGLGIDSLTSKLGLNVKSLLGWGAAIGAGKVALDVMKDAFFFNEQQLDDWGSTVEASKGIYDGFLNALNSGDISGFLTNMNDIVRAAEAAYNAMDELGTFNAFNSINLEGAQADFQEALAGYRTKEKSKEDVEAAAQKLKAELEERKKKEWDAYIQAVRKSAIVRGANPDDVVKALQGSYQDWNNLKHSNLVGSGTKERYNALTRSYDIIHYAETDAEKLSEFARQINDKELETLQQMGAQAERTRREAAAIDKQMSRVLNSKQGTDPTKSTKTTKEVQNTKGSVAELTKELRELQKEQQQSTNPQQWDSYQKKIEEVTKRVKELKGELPNLELGGMPNIHGIDIAGDYLKDAKKRGTLPTRESVIAQGQASLKNFMGVDLTPEKSDKDFIKELRKLTSGISSITGGIKAMGFKLPEEIDQAIGVINGVMSVIEGVNTVISVFGNTELTANTAAIIANTTALYANTAIPSIFAGGGVVHAASGYIVPGNRFSGDNIPALLNSGETVLNKAQAGVIAHELQGGGMKDIKLSARLSGGDIILAVDRTLMVQGKGQMATFK